MVAFGLAFLLASCDRGGGRGTKKPSASFIYSPVSPVASQAVQFTDTSTGSSTSWQWNFGDGITSVVGNPSHIYTTAASYTVTLTVGNSTGSDNASQTVVVPPGAKPTASFPLKVGPTGRYLVDQDDTPFLMIGDSPQSLMVNVSLSDADFLLANRASYGFNAVWINLLCTEYTYGRADASTIDGLKPFNTPSDLSTPNEAYFAQCDQIIRSAGSHGITVILDPIETGGFLGMMRANGVNKCKDYGRYVGNRYKSFDNIIWMSGNDFQSWRDAGDDDLVKAVATGIKEVDQRHIHTLELDYYVSSSLDNANWTDVVNLNAAYTYFPTYIEVLKDYNRTPVVPAFLIEADYELQYGADHERLRRQEYWSFLAGACGYVYGIRYVVRMLDGWKDNLVTTGSTQLGYCRDLFKSRPWHSLVPDQKHTLVTAGYGAFSSRGDPHESISKNNYVTAALTNDGKLALVYVPSSRKITVDLTKLTGSVTARWYDPTAGTYQAIAGSPFSNTGSHAFRTPGTHSDGASDWVLVLEKQ